MPIALISSLALFAIIITYLVSMSSLDVTTKSSVMVSIVTIFLAGSIVVFIRQAKRSYSKSESSVIGMAEVNRTLSELEDVNEFFAGSIDSSDAFRLVTSRVKKLVQCRTISLWLVDRATGQLHLCKADGANVEYFKGMRSSVNNGVARRACHSNVVEIDNTSSVSPLVVAIPLCRSTRPFGVLQLEFDGNLSVPFLDRSIFEAIGSRTSTLILSSLSYEKSRESALTDTITDLPNERAFRIVLENQVAESCRKGNDRPLTILAIDVRSFDNINYRFGHSVGDRVLNLVASVIKENLRQMDFFARAAADEFLVVLPTASNEISHEVVARIHTGFFGRKLNISDTESVEIELNVGSASFGTDGENPQALLSVARERKEQAKSTGTNKVLWFPTELAG